MVWGVTLKQFGLLFLAVLFAGCGDTAASSDAGNTPVPDAHTSSDAGNTPVPDADPFENIWEGDITTEEDLIAAVDATLVTGEISLQNIDIAKISLPKLVRVDGTIIVQQVTSLTSVMLPQLVHVGEHLFVRHNEALSSVLLPLLQKVEKGFDVYGNVVLTQLDVSSLNRVASISLGNNWSLISTVFPSLERIDLRLSLSCDTLFLGTNALECEGARLPSTISLPVLVSVGERLSVANAKSLTSFSAPALTTVGGELSFAQNSDLVSVNLPGLVRVEKKINFYENQAVISYQLASLASAGSITIAESTLQRISFSSLSEILGSLTISNNRKLTAVSMPLLDNVEGNIYIRGNDISLSDCDLGRYTYECI